MRNKTRGRIHTPIKLRSAIGLLLLILSVSCGGKEEGTPAPTALPVLTPREVIEKASPLLDTLASFHFELTQEGGGTPIDMGIEMTAASGEVVPPDRLRMDITGTWGRMYLSTKLVTVGEETYMQNPLNKKWEPTKFTAITLFQPDTGIKAIMESVTDLAMLPGESINGTVCFHMSGMLRSEVLDAVAVGHAAEGLPVQTEIWIGAEDFLLRRVTFKGQITEEEVPGIVRTLTLSRFNEPVTIELPSAKRLSPGPPSILRAGPVAQRGGDGLEEPVHIPRFGEIIGGSE